MQPSLKHSIPTSHPNHVFIEDLEEITLLGKNLITILLGMINISSIWWIEGHKAFSHQMRWKLLHISVITMKRMTFNR